MHKSLLVSRIRVGVLTCAPAALLFLSTSVLVGADAQLPPKHPATYVEFYREILTNHRGHARKNFKTDAKLAGVALRLWNQTGDAAFRKETLNYFARSFSDPQFSLADFHILHHFGELVAKMKEEGLLTPEQRQQISKIARATLAGYLKQPDDTKQPPGAPLFNIRLGQIAGYAGLLRFLKDESFDSREEVNRKLNAYFDLLSLTGTPDEDAANYDSLGMAFAVDLARLLGRETDLQSPVFKRCFENFRDVVSPSGIIPEYGDSYFNYEGAPLDRLYLMEEAARIFGDASFAGAARKMRNRPLTEPIHEDSWMRSLHLIEIGAPYPADGKDHGGLSQVLLRNVSHDGQTVQAVRDKLILRTGRAPGDSMILMDLYASGSHAAKDKGPSIAYYESDQVPLFHNMGRRGTRSAICGNICWALPATERFPGRWNPGEWFTMSIPAELIATNAAGQCVLSSMWLRNFSGHPDNRGCTSLAFDNLRLEGPAGIRLIDGFESAAGWDSHLRHFTESQNSSDRTEGQYSQVIAWNKVKTDGISRKLPPDHLEPFTKDQFDQLKLDVKFTGSRPYILVRGFGEELEMGDRVLRPELKDAVVEQRGSDAFGTILYDRYITADSTLNRHIVLTKEGYLIIRDSLLPGVAMDGWNSGQLWQLYTLAAHGDHWFCSDDDGVYPDVSGKPDANPQRRMFVRFAADNATEAGFEKVQRTITCPNPKKLPPTSFVTTFSQRKVTAGKPAVFGMVVLPAGPKVTPDSLAKTVSVNTTPTGNVEAVVKGSSTTVVIRISDNDWSVTRQPREQQQKAHP